MGKADDIDALQSSVPDYVCGRTEENHEISQPGKSVLLSGFELICSELRTEHCDYCLLGCDMV